MFSDDEDFEDSFIKSSISLKGKENVNGEEMSVLMETVSSTEKSASGPVIDLTDSPRRLCKGKNVLQSTAVKTSPVSSNATLAATSFEEFDDMVELVDLEIWSQDVDQKVMKGKARDWDTEFGDLEDSEFDLELKAPLRKQRRGVSHEFTDEGQFVEEFVPLQTLLAENRLVANYSISNDQDEGKVALLLPPIGSKPKRSSNSYQKPKKSWKNNGYKKNWKNTRKR